MSDIGTIIAAGANMVGNIATNQINAERAASDMATYLNLVKKQRDWQKEDYAWSEDYTKRMMDYQYENFSSPSAQMAAYKKAGLNPWVIGQGHDVGSGQGVSPTSAPSPSRIGVSPFQRPPLNDPFSGGVSAILQGSSVQNQRLAAMAEILKSAPDAFKALGKKGFDSVMSSLFGQVVDSSLIESISNAESVNAESEAKIKSIEADLAAKYGDTKASNFVALQEQSFNKMAAEIGKMASDTKVNDATVRKYVSEYVRNFADAYKLRKEGDKYLIEGDYYNALIDLTHQSFMRLKYQNLMQGFFDKSFVHDALMSHDYQGKLAQKLQMWNTWTSDPTWTMVDRFLNDYLKVFGASANSVGGASVNTTVTPVP